MARMTVVVGVVLIVVGIVAFVSTGSTHPTSLIPCWFGLVLAACGALANTNDAKRRMLVMHIAVTVGLLGFVFPAVMAIKDTVEAHGSPAHPAAVEEQAVMAVICLVFVALCVRSFIAARKTRLA